MGVEPFDVHPAGATHFSPAADSASIANTPENNKIATRMNPSLSDRENLPGHEKWMRLALDLALEAEESGEVPVGCVLVAGGEVIGQARNSPIELLDPTAHAEMLALRQGAIALGNYRLSEATLYCTLEPCAMCAGALVAARISTLVFGARDLRFGAVRSKFQIADSPLLNHRVEVIEGVLGAESTALLQRFFRQRRASPA
jgi:tRNA(adenine34) deaminase